VKCLNRACHIDVDDLSFLSGPTEIELPCTADELMIHLSAYTNILIGTGHG
jgi:hypothetical protein